MKQVYKFLIFLAVVISTISALLVFAPRNDAGEISFSGENAKLDENIQNSISDYNKEVGESSAEILARISETDAPTDAATMDANDEPSGQGFHTTVAEILARRKADGDNDGGRGWQCSKYTAYLATGKKDYSNANPDYGPVNGNQVADWLVRNYGFKYISEPVAGAIGSGGFDTRYGHTVMYLGGGMVNDANWSPLRVLTHSMSLVGYKWVVPGDYQPENNSNDNSANNSANDAQNSAQDYVSGNYVVKNGDTLGGIILKNGWRDANLPLFGDDGQAQDLAEENGISNRGLIFPAQIIKNGEN